MTMPNRDGVSAVECFGVRVARWRFPEFLAWFDRAVDGNDGCVSLAIVNAHTLNLVHESPPFRDTLNTLSVVLNDGVGLEFYGRVAGAPFHYNFNGTDLLPAIFAHRAAPGKGLRVFLFGARPGVAARAAEQIQERFPGVSVVGVADGYSSLSDAEMVELINAATPQLVLVALGNPLQEEWIARNQVALTAGVVCGVGALLDFLSGTVPRAPAWMRASRLEWCYRLWLEPKRMFRRYVIGNPLFLYRVVVSQLADHAGRAPRRG